MIRLAGAFLFLLALTMAAAMADPRIATYGGISLQTFGVLGTGTSATTCLATGTTATTCLETR